MSAAAGERTGPTDSIAALTQRGAILDAAGLDRDWTRSYSSFKGWTSSVIDLFKNELGLLSFPVFVTWSVHVLLL